MNRRGFLSAVAGLVAGSAVDPEKLLWVPGRKLISIPEPFVSVTASELIERAARDLAEDLDNRAQHWYELNCILHRWNKGEDDFVRLVYPDGTGRMARVRPREPNEQRVLIRPAPLRSF